MNQAKLLSSPTPVTSATLPLRSMGIMFASLGSSNARRNSLSGNV
jgi:hypothetical protein